MLRDLVSRIDPVDVVSAALLTASPTPTVIDLSKNHSLLLEVAIGAGGITFTGTNKLEVRFEHSDDNSNWSNCATGDIITAAGVTPVLTGGIPTTESYVAAKAAASRNFYGYLGMKTYVRVTPVFSGTHATGTVCSITGLRGHPERLQA